MWTREIKQAIQRRISESMKMLNQIPQEEQPVELMTLLQAAMTRTDVEASFEAQDTEKCVHCEKPKVCTPCVGCDRPICGTCKAGPDACG